VLRATGKRKEMHMLEKARRYGALNRRRSQRGRDAVSSAVLRKVVGPARGRLTASQKKRGRETGELCGRSPTCRPIRDLIPRAPRRGREKMESKTSPDFHTVKKKLLLSLQARLATFKREKKGIREEIYAEEGDRR